MGWNHQPGKLGNFVKHIKSSESFCLGRDPESSDSFAGAEKMQKSLTDILGYFGHLSELVFL